MHGLVGCWAYLDRVGRVHERVRFYVVKFTSAAYELEAPEASDWGELPTGTLVLDAQHTNLLMKGSLVYGENPESIRVPVEQVLHAWLHVFSDMAPYQLPNA